MSVKCLDDYQKSFVIVAYKTKLKSQKELAEHLGVSERTINRVLIEAGLATPVERIKGEAYQVMQLLKKHGLDFQGLKALLEKASASQTV